MATDRHLGRNYPTFTIRGNPQKYIGLEDRHGVWARIMQGRKCPCVTSAGSPDLYCKLCDGDGTIYEYQRKLLETDEDCNCVDGITVTPFRVPLIEPVKIERLISPEQGGNKTYSIVDFDQYNIIISGKPEPRPFEKMRVSYYFDRFNYTEKDYLKFDRDTNSLETTKTLIDDEYNTGNVHNIHNDIAIIEKIFDEQTGTEIKNYKFRKNKIFINGQMPTEGKTWATYWQCPVTVILPQDMENRIELQKEQHELGSSSVRFAIEPWFNISDGDIITLLSPIYWKYELHKFNGSVNRLIEFDIQYVDDKIFSQSGRNFTIKQDFIFRNFREIHWIGRKPDVGEQISIRYGYNPTYRIFIDQANPNALENKPYPIIVFAKLWNSTMSKELKYATNNN